MQRLIDTWRHYRRRLGAREAALALTSIALARATARRCQLVSYSIVAQPVPEAPLPTGSRGRNISVRRLTEGDPALLAFPRPHTVFQSRFAQGAVCYGAFRDNEPIGFIWFTLGPYEEDEVRCLYRPHPERKTAWDFDVYVAPPYRLSPAFVCLWNAAYAHMREHGVEWTISRISAFNATSLSSHRRLGARDIGRLNFLSFGPVQFLMASMSPRMHVCAKHPSRPTIDVDVDKAGLLSRPTKQRNSDA